jgi:hypothetical protein
LLNDEHAHLLCQKKFGIAKSGVGDQWIGKMTTFSHPNNKHLSQYMDLLMAISFLFTLLDELPLMRHLAKVARRSCLGSPIQLDNMYGNEGMLMKN